MENKEEEISSILYDVGLNDDPFSVWRNSYHIGYVQLSFRIIVEAMYDLICGSPNDILSASIFFYGRMYKLSDLKDKEREPYGKEDDPVDYSTGSLYPIYAEILGYDSDTLPKLVMKHRTGNVSAEDVENLRNLYTVMVTI